MIFSSTKSSLILLVACCLFVQRTQAAVICEELPKHLCSYAVSSSGKRCVLENYNDGGGSHDYACKTSEITVERLYGYIETDECVNACGVDRGAVGISSDPLLSPGFTARLCSSACYHNCPNIVDLYLNLAAGEGVSLPVFCEKLRRNSHSAVLTLLSSGSAAAPQASLGPVAAPTLAPAPAYI